MGVVLLAMVMFPAVGAGAVCLWGRDGHDRPRRIALYTSLATLALALLVVFAYRVPAAEGETGTDATLQMTTNWQWMTSPDIRFALGVDGISLWLVGLTALLLVTSVLVSWEEITDRPIAYYGLLLLLGTGMLGVFTAQDVILFYIFFEFTLVPLFFIIGIWGHHERRWAARKFFIYTLAGSLLTFLSLVFLALVPSWFSDNPVTFSIPDLTRTLPEVMASSAAARAFWDRAAPLVFLGLFAGFAVKVPLFPLHTWLPLAHFEAPTAGSVLLAGVLLKVGTYGFVRFSLALLPEESVAFVGIVAVLAIVGILYGALVALAQQDMKRLVAYSSVSHLGFCMLGLFALNPVGLNGAILQMLNHGLSTGALFALVGMVYARYHTRDIELVGGLTRRMPVMAFFLVLMALSSVGLPGLNGFVGEVMVLLGMFREHPVYAAFATAGIVLGAWYMLWLVERTFFGPLREPRFDDTHEPIADLSRREIAALAPLAVLVVWIGVYPQFFLRRMEPSVAPIAASLSRAKLARASGDEAEARTRRSPIAVSAARDRLLHEVRATIGLFVPLGTAGGASSGTQRTKDARPSE